MNCTISSDRSGALDLMGRVLRDGGEIASEYPLVFDERFSGRVLTAHTEEQVSSACAILSRDFVVQPGLRVKGGLIGSVATDEAYRGKGLATRVLVEAEAALQIEGCAFSLLWSQDPDFYLRRGYGPIGSEVDIVVTGDIAEALPLGEGIREMDDRDAAAVHALYQAHGSRVDRTLEETAALLDCPAMTKLVIERDGELLAYACVGRGGDFVNTLHEWGGRTIEVLALVRELAQRAFDGAPEGVEPALLMMAPSGASDVIDALEALGAPMRASMLGLGKILDRAAAAEVLDRLIGSSGEVDLAEVEGAQRFRLRSGDREGLLDDEGALALLCGVPEVHEDVQGFLTEFGFEGAPLPLQPFAWGLDSI